MTGEGQKWVAALAIGVLVWFMWRNRNGMLEKTDFAKSFKVMGVLAIILIVFVGVLVMIAKQS